MKAIKKVRFALVCVSLMVAGISYAKIDLETCVGVWLFDEGKGNIASDSCENGSDGKIHGGAKWVGYTIACAWLSLHFLLSIYNVEIRC